jgi:CheY-like chemotaxis protein
VQKEGADSVSKILIVDDDPHIRELSGVFLRNAGFEIVEANDGVDALAKLESTKVDLFIIDIMMPRMDGWELSRGSSWERTIT